MNWVVQRSILPNIPTLSLDFKIAYLAIRKSIWRKKYSDKPVWVCTSLWPMRIRFRNLVCLSIRTSVLTTNKKNLLNKLLRAYTSIFQKMSTCRLKCKNWIWGQMCHFREDRLIDPQWFAQTCFFKVRFFKIFISKLMIIS